MRCRLGNPTLSIRLHNVQGLVQKQIAGSPVQKSFRISRPQQQSTKLTTGPFSAEGPCWTFYYTTVAGVPAKAQSHTWDPPSLGAAGPWPSPPSFLSLVASPPILLFILSHSLGYIQGRTFPLPHPKTSAQVLFTLRISLLIYTLPQTRATKITEGMWSLLNSHCGDP